MNILKSYLKWMAAFLAVCLFFGQMALAAYDCPKLSAALTAASMNQPLADSFPLAMTCAGQMDQEQSSLCQAHCQDTQALKLPQTTDVSPSIFKLLWLPPAITLHLALPSSYKLSRDVALVQQAPPPAIYLFFQVFRI